MDINASNNMLLLKYIQEGNAIAVAALINRGVDVNKKNSKGNTPLHHSLNYKNEEVLKILIDAGADVHTKNNKGLTALQCAISRNSKMAKILIKSGADIHLRGKENKTLLHVAAEKNDVPLIKLLISGGANTYARDKQNRIPLLSAIFGSCVEESYSESIEILLKTKVPMIESDELSTNSQFSDMKSHVNFKDDYGQTPLFEVVRRGQLKVVQLLIDHGSNVNVFANRTPHETPLHLACSFSDEKMIKLLLHNGADVNAYIYQSPPVFHYLVWSCRCRI